jgi:dodecin
MPGVHKKIEIVGTSSVSISDAVKNAVAEAGKSVRHLEWFEVKEARGRIRDGAVAEFQVTIMVGFKLEPGS